MVQTPTPILLSDRFGSQLLGVLLWFISGILANQARHGKASTNGMINECHVFCSGFLSPRKLLDCGQTGDIHVLASERHYGI